METIVFNMAVETCTANTLSWSVEFARSTIFLWRATIECKALSRKISRGALYTLQQVLRSCCGNVSQQLNVAAFIILISATMRITGGSLRFLAFWWFATLVSIAASKSPNVNLLRNGRRLQPRQYSYWSPQEIHSTLLQWKDEYPNLVRVKTAQDAYGLFAAGNSSDCPYDDGDGCFNYILTIQDFSLHPENSSSSNALPEVFWSGELHGDERVGPTAVMEAATLLLQVASCEATSLESNPSCSSVLQEQGIGRWGRQWLARLVTTRRIVIVPTANALGYYQNTRREGDVDVNRDFPFDYEDSSLCMQTIAGESGRLARNNHTCPHIAVF